MAVFVVIFALGRYVSLASILGTAAFPLFAWLAAPWTHNYLISAYRHRRGLILISISRICRAPAWQAPSIASVPETKTAAPGEARPAEPHHVWVQAHGEPRSCLLANKVVVCPGRGEPGEEREGCCSED